MAMKPLAPAAIPNEDIHSREARYEDPSSPPYPAVDRAKLDAAFRAVARLPEYLALNKTERVDFGAIMRQAAETGVEPQNVEDTGDF